jgi:Icc-related predicted phosphoesterase
VIRIAAVGDIHVGEESRDVFGTRPEALAEEADVLLLAGDLTRRGQRSEAAVLAGELARTGGVPTIAVLGNHDYETNAAAELVAVLADVGVTVLEGSAHTVDTSGGRLGVAGTKGFGGGFQGASGAEFGEPEMKAFIAHTRALATGLTTALTSLNGVTARVALLHYSPIESTLQGERLEIYPFLGSYLLAEAVDRGGAQLALHGHAHRGAEKGVTPGGTLVRNVAQPVLRRPYGLYCLGGDGTSCAS